MKKHTLHGAVILSNGCAHVFLCPTGGGKSTLTVYLHKRGLPAWTDDRAELDYDTLAVFPRSDAVALREGGYRLLQDKGMLSPLDVEYDPDPGRERYYFQLPSCGMEPLPLGSIWLLRRGEENWTESVQKASAVRLLMENAMDPVPITGEHLRFLNRLSERVKGILHYRDMEFVYKVLTGRKSE